MVPPKLSWVLFALLAVEGFLFVSEQAGWFGFHEDRISPFLFAMAAVIAPIFLMFFWIFLRALWDVFRFFGMVARLAYRRRFQYSLRTLLLVVTLFAIACSWLAVKIRQAQRQQEAVAEIQKLGGSIVYDWPAGWKPARNVLPPPGPAWLRSLLGVDLFLTVHAVDVSGIQVTDEDVNKLQQALPNSTITH